MSFQQAVGSAFRAGPQGGELQRSADASRLPEPLTRRFVYSRMESCAAATAAEIINVAARERGGFDRLERRFCRIEAAVADVRAAVSRAGFSASPLPGACEKLQCRRIVLRAACATRTGGRVSGAPD